jgi:hypothetical protein
MLAEEWCLGRGTDRFSGSLGKPSVAERCWTTIKAAGDSIVTSLESHFGGSQ